MKKIPCLFERDFSDRQRPVLLDKVTPGCEWVLSGEGVATRKWDGTACAIIGGRLYARLDCKRGKIPPIGAIPCSDPDPVTGHWPHWVPADRPVDIWIRAALEGKTGDTPEGTYEAIGPMIGSNHENVSYHTLVRHGIHVLIGCPRDFEGLRSFLEVTEIEGVVFHHPDSRMVKIRRDDYGFEWPLKGTK